MLLGLVCLVANALPASPAWATRDETTAIEGYADTVSAAPGERVGFHVASGLPGARYRIELYRLGWYGGGGARLVACLPGCEADRPAPAPAPPAVDPATGVFRAAWPETDALVVPTDWVSGYYEARLLSPRASRPADPRLQQFMRNALADLLRPAPPAAVTASPAPGLVRVSVQLRPDPRVREVVVSRLEDDRATVVCSALPCTDRVPGHRAYRYSAAVADPWAESPATLSEVVTVPNSAPVVRLAGTRTVRLAARAVYTATAPDADGDPVDFRWRVDGRLRPPAGARLAVRFRAPGRHRVAVSAGDGHGGVAQAAVAVRVRSRR